MESLGPPARWGGGITATAGTRGTQTGHQNDRTNCGCELLAEGNPSGAQPAGSAHRLDPWDAGMEGADKSQQPAMFPGWTASAEREGIVIASWAPPVPIASPDRGESTAAANASQAHS